MDCLFCKIISGEIPSKTIYEDENVLAFFDIDGRAPVHFLVIPKKHIKSIDEITENDKNLIGELMLSIKKIAKDLKLESGYRIVSNCGEDGGQSVDHLHFHVLAGRKLSWPPG